MKKIEWSYARILLLSILVIFIVSLMSCEKEEDINCDCEKITYRLEHHMWFNLEGFPRRCQVEIEMNKETDYCGDETEPVYIDRINGYETYYKINCN